MNILRTCKSLLGLIDGTIQSITIVSGGSGYVVGTVTVNGAGSGTGFDADYTVDADGAIDSITVNDDGASYPASITVEPSDAGNGDAELVAVMGSTAKDTLLNFYIDSISEWLLQYLNRSEIPSALEFWIVKKVIAQYNQDGGTAVATASGDVVEIQRGDTRIKYASSGAGFAGVASTWMSQQDLLTLDPFRVVRFT